MTDGEVEFFEFTGSQMRDGTGMLRDAYAPAVCWQGAVPGSVNVPFTTLSKKTDYLEMIGVLKRLGSNPGGISVHDAQA
ncbi:MAG: hypothetical protein B0D96_07195 [Candidatus Sedimenticola endophacoides]|uniref:Uncharacterized protein n=1 Tax=Candidatus Sedimenticola endophacoides TaxID=2548426 RepID=A0A657PUD4_9GAMM|nr:MAG: hypothetical protein B0D84_03790 [Candidatus Sedimenticola endophacoides]OQX35275.1 MAG: hypothetical protein B0D96_07195 [Candidatus Sedimenticola endophacoides]OQX41145.1 MAG: hypothetical protein B0D89_05105 [Candidatus Sedimenticola endophacoides]OQX42281.1 MAG: hypothetical protein B0D82_01290 [Candidatus Sedimenticola endophacoides]OQX45130.1 MAG: hypothetical protein B0D86_04195 [Candidatus Sedimenticola endophacoides]